MAETERDKQIGNRDRTAELDDIGKGIERRESEIERGGGGRKREREGRERVETETDRQIDREFQDNYFFFFPTQWCGYKQSTHQTLSYLPYYQKFTYRYYTPASVFKYT